MLTYYFEVIYFQFSRCFGERVRKGKVLIKFNVKHGFSNVRSSCSNWKSFVYTTLQVCVKREIYIHLSMSLKALVNTKAICYITWDIIYIQIWSLMCTRIH